MLLSFVIGTLLGIAGFLLTRIFLKFLNCPLEVMDLADIYLKIYFLGMPAISAYNFSSSSIFLLSISKSNE